MFVFLHLEIDGYRATTTVRRLERDGSGSTNYSFTSKRMVPPKTRMKFFFSSDGRYSLLLSSYHEILIVPYKQIPFYASVNMSKIVDLSADFYKIESGCLYLNRFNVVEGSSTKPCVQLKTFAPSSFLKPRQDIYLNQALLNRFIDSKQKNE